MSGSKEHQLGKGTLGYKGETAEYYESKRGLWDRFRWVLAAVCLVIGIAFLVASTSPVVTATVLSVTQTASSDPSVAVSTNDVVLLAPDGATTTVTTSFATSPAVGSTQSAMQLPGGRLVLGDYSAQGRGAGLLFVALGLGVALMAVWRIRRPKPQTTTVLAPDDTYALPPHTS